MLLLSASIIMYYILELFSLGGVPGLVDVCVTKQTISVVVVVDVRINLEEGEIQMN